jgi:DNA polymerase III gamma/tau subunit
MRSLYEQYRPSCWEEMAGQDKLVRGLSVLRRRGLVGRVFWLAGDSGTGKTTVARLIAAEKLKPTNYESPRRNGVFAEMDALRGA